MPGMCTPAEAAAGKAVIDAEAERVGRRVDPEHFGVNLSWVDEMNDQVRVAVADRRSDVAAEDLIAIGPSGLVERMNAFLEVGFSKFVIRPLLTPESWSDARGQRLFGARWPDSLAPSGVSRRSVGLTSQGDS